MTPSFSFTSGGYFVDILGQPEALQNTLDALPGERREGVEHIAQQLAGGRFRQVILTGMGSSLYVFHPFFLHLLQHGFPVRMVETSELLYYQRPLLTPETLVIAASQSGKSAEILSLLEAITGRVSILGVTNTPESPLALRADAILFTRAGAETTVSCKTHLTALLALRWLADILSGTDPRPTLQELALAPGLVRGYLEHWRAHVEELREALKGARQMYYVGRGPSLAAVGTAGLTTKESAHFPAEGMTSAAFRHGPLEISGPETAVVLFAGDPRTQPMNRRLAEVIGRLKGKVFWIGEEGGSPACTLPKAPAALLPILEMLPVQMITLALADLQGHIAGDFRYSSKVTSVE